MFKFTKNKEFKQMYNTVGQKPNLHVDNPDCPATKVLMHLEMIIATFRH